MMSECLAVHVSWGLRRRATGKGVGTLGYLQEHVSDATALLNGTQEKNSRQSSLSSSAAYANRMLGNCTKVFPNKT